MKVYICFILTIASFLSCKNHPSTIDDFIISNEDLLLEKDYEEMLLPIQNLKVKEPKIYWFVVSWLNTEYKTPNWNNYNATDWKEKTKKIGIDCSGFARVMQHEIFNRKIRGSSSGILKNYCKSKGLNELEIGDLVFFKANNSSNSRIVHVGVFLTDGYFVHATSKKSAAKGLGLNISSLEEERWKNEFVTGGSIKIK